MDDMEWAKWGLDYLHEARVRINDQFNAAMDEFRGNQPSRRESWFSASKNIISTLYHFSSEFVEDRAVPGSKFASPQAFKDELVGYHAFVVGMRDQLVEEDQKYKDSKKETEDKGTLWHISVTLNPVMYLLEAVEYVQSKMPTPENVTPEIDDIHVVETMARRFHESVLSLAKHPHNGTILTITNEWDCQYLFKSILASYFPDIRSEEWGPSVAGSSARCEFLLKTIKTMVELKYVRVAADQKKVKKELAVDFVDYGNNPLVDHLVCLVYDPLHVLENPIGFQNDLSGPAKGLVKVSVILSPPRAV